MPLFAPGPAADPTYLNLRNSKVAGGVDPRPQRGLLPAT